MGEKTLREIFVKFLDERSKAAGGQFLTQQEKGTALRRVPTLLTGSQAH